MKKLIIITIAVASSALLAACGSSGSSEPSPTTQITSSTTTTSSSPASNKAAVEAAIVSLLEGESSVCGNTVTTSCWDYMEQHNYPGAINAASYSSCVTKVINQNKDSGGVNYYPSTADFTTLVAVPGWKLSGPSASSPYDKAITPKGTTYLVTVNTGGLSGGSSYAHITILNGQAYYYAGPICN